MKGKLATINRILPKVDRNFCFCGFARTGLFCVIRPDAVH